MIEPHVRGSAALHSPRTAVVDFAAIAEAMADDVRGADGHVLLRHEVVGIHSQLDRLLVRTSGGDHHFDRLVICAGLQSDVVARMVGASPAPRILPFRGEYWALVPDRRALVAGMVYPVPDPRYPFLGVHFTRGVYDQVTVGPNAVPALAREGYRWRDVSGRDLWEIATWPGAPALAREHWRTGFKEIGSSVMKSRYGREARRFIPELQSQDLQAKIASGVRAQAWNRDGSLADDFAVDTLGAVTLIRNAPSPAATSAMAIAEHLMREHVL
ncbi:L-2-hydroxyglutarate oxidase [Nocardioides panacis]|uniref:L-2-hydroxyglutarate oxidase n=1 Tax=Nocardioides panacis TaxID=2849501 RepID=UPI0020B3E23B|nr:L-2-hydroxyglutarate oxidase [Nocardioides panacis]